MVQVLEAELERLEARPAERVECWRVLATATLEEGRRRQWIKRIRDVWLDEQAPDRAEAARALAELHYVLDKDQQVACQEQMRSADRGLAVAAAQLLVGQAPDTATARLAELLNDQDAHVRAAAAEALARLAQPVPAVWSSLRTRLADEPLDSPARPAMLLAGLMHASPKDRRELGEELRQLARRSPGFPAIGCRTRVGRDGHARRHPTAAGAERRPCGRRASGRRDGGAAHGTPGPAGTDVD